jgi:hypothetical protein
MPALALSLVTFDFPISCIISPLISKLTIRHSTLQSISRYAGGTNPQVFINYDTYERCMKREDRATISVSKGTHVDFEEYRAKLSAEKKKVQTQDDVVRALLKKANE